MALVWTADRGPFLIWPSGQHGKWLSLIHALRLSVGPVHGGHPILHRASGIRRETGATRWTCSKCLLRPPFGVVVTKEEGVHHSVCVCPSVRLSSSLVSFFLLFPFFLCPFSCSLSFGLILLSLDEESHILSLPCVSLYPVLFPFSFLLLALSISATSLFDSALDSCS